MPVSQKRVTNEQNPKPLYTVLHKLLPSGKKRGYLISFQLRREDKSASFIYIYALKSAIYVTLYINETDYQ